MRFEEFKELSENYNVIPVYREFIADMSTPVSALAGLMGEKDDYLDVYGDPAVFGKKIGGDILCNKKTYMLINALLLADDRQRAELKRWIDAREYEPQEKIQAVTALYDQIGIRELCDKKITAYFEKAGECLNALEVDDCRKQMLREFIGSLIHRNV